MCSTSYLIKRASNCKRYMVTTSKINKLFIAGLNHFCFGLCGTEQDKKLYRFDVEYDLEIQIGCNHLYLKL